MAYYPLQIPTNLPPNLRAVTRKVMDPLFREFHHLLTVRDPGQGPKGSFQGSQAILLVALADGAAQFLWPEPGMREGERFRRFLKKYYPWDRDEPDGFTRDEAVAFLWNEVRCALLHRFGIRHSPDKLHKFGNVHTLLEARVVLLERSDVRPFSDPFLRQDDQRTVLWIEAFYWGLRQAIEKALQETPNRLNEMEQWISSGQYDRKKGRPAP